MRRQIGSHVMINGCVVAPTGATYTAARIHRVTLVVSSFTSCYNTEKFSVVCSMFDLQRLQDSKKKKNMYNIMQEALSVIKCIFNKKYLIRRKTLSNQIKYILDSGSKHQTWLCTGLFLVRVQ